MVSFAPDNDLSLMVETANRFAQDKLRPVARQAERSGSVPPELATQFAELGLGLVEVPEACGGMGLGLGASVALHEALATGDAGLSMALPQPGAFGRFVRLCGTAAQQQALLQPFADN